MQHARFKFAMLSALGVFALTAAAAPAVGQSAAQSVETHSAHAFLGTWTLAFQPMGGGAGGGAGRQGAGGGAAGAGAGAGGGGAAGARPGGGGGGRGAMTLAITDQSGRIGAELTGGMIGGQPVTQVALNGTSLVLSFTLAAQGQSRPATLTLTPDGANMKAELKSGDAAARTGTATRQP